MEGCPAGDAGPVLNTGGGSDAQGFDYAILPPILSRVRLAAMPPGLGPGFRGFESHMRDQLSPIS